jgi:YfiH family protein
VQRVTVQDLVYYQFDQFVQNGRNVVHACFTRLGGASRPPWQSLNTGHTVGDDLAHVRENHERICQALGIRRSEIVSPHQVHSAIVRVVGDRDRGAVKEGTDALVTDVPGVYLMLRFADCVPVLFYDPVRGAVGLAHAGWRGTVACIARATVQRMAEAFGCRPADIRAGIGASIGPCCYEVGDEVVEAVREAFPVAPFLLQRRASGRWHFDLWAANRYQLFRAGLTSVEVSGLCTACRTDEWFSHRAEMGRTGRLGAVIGLRE